VPSFSFLKFFLEDLNQWWVLRVEYVFRFFKHLEGLIIAAFEISSNVLIEVG
jgi:hypothetical protein